jgi:hypothetical protein
MIDEVKRLQHVTALVVAALPLRNSALGTPAITLHLIVIRGFFPPSGTRRTVRIGAPIPGR